MDKENLILLEIAISIIFGLALLIGYRKKLSGTKVLGAAIVLMFAVGVSVVIVSLSSIGKETVEVQALETKNRDAVSNQVFLTGYNLNGTYTPIQSLSSGYWERSSEPSFFAWLPPEHTAWNDKLTDSVQFAIPYGKGRTIQFLTDTYCGIAQITVGNASQVIDTFLASECVIPDTDSNLIMWNGIKTLGIYTVLFILISTVALLIWKKTNQIFVLPIHSSGVINSIEAIDKTATYNEKCGLYISDNFKVFAWYKKIPKEMLIAAGSALTLGLFTHMYMLTNKFANPDDTRHMFGLGVTISGGRFGLAALGEKWPGLDISILPTYSMPWLNGLLSIVFIGLAAAFIVRILRIRSVGACIFTGAIMVVYPTVAATFHYMFTAPAYFLSLLICVLAVYFARECHWGGIIAAVIMLCVTLSIYQAYYFFAVGLFVLALFCDAVDEGKMASGWGGIFVVQGLQYLCVLLGGMVLYFVLNKGILYLTNIELVAYAGLDSMFQINFEGLGSALKSCYSNFFKNTWAIVDEGAGFRLLVVLGLFTSATIHWINIFWMNRKKSAAYAAGIIALLIIIPLAGNGVYVVSRQFVHSLMIYPTIIFFLFCITGYDRSKRNAVSLMCKFVKKTRKDGARLCLTSVLSALCLFAIIFNYIVITNAVYLGSQITTQQALSYLNRLAMRIEMTDGYNQATTPVVFVGSPNMQERPQALSDLYSLNNLVGVSFNYNESEGVEENTLLNTFANTNLQQLQRYLGFAVIFPTIEQKNVVESSEAVLQLPCYPNQNSIQIIDDILVVKFSDINQ